MLFASFLIEKSSLGIRCTDFYSLIQTKACLSEGNVIYPLLELVVVYLCKSLNVEYMTCFLPPFSD